MDIISEVISSAGEIKLMELESKIERLSHDVKCTTDQIHREYLMKYHNLIPIKTGDLFDILSSMKENVNELKNGTHQKVKHEETNLEDNLVSLEGSINKISNTVLFLERTCRLHECFDEIKVLYYSNDFLGVAKKLFQIETWLNPDIELQNFFDIYCGFFREKVEINNNLIHHIQKSWNACFDLKSIDIDKRTRQSSLEITNLQLLENTFLCIEYFSSLLTSEISKTSDFILNKILSPILLWNCSTDCQDNSSKTVKFTVTYKYKSQKMDFKTVLKQLSIFFSFLNSNLNFNNETHNFLVFLGRNVSNDFIKMFIDEQIKYNTPFRSSELVQYEEMVGLILDLESLLLSQGFLEKRNELLSIYCDDIEKVFEENQVNKFMEEAEKIMKRDFHDMESLDPMLLDSSSDVVEISSQSIKKYFDSKFQISKLIKSLISLIVDCLNECKSKPQDSGHNLVEAANNIVSHFLIFVPKYHSNLLEKIPQQAAILHNNCLYLIASIHDIQKHFQEQFIEQESKDLLLQSIKNFVVPLEALATKVLDKQINIQKNQIKEAIDSCGLSELSCSTHYPASIEKGVRQCMRQLFLLQTVWQHVLTQNKYCTVIGNICDTLISHIIDNITCATDIGEEIALLLVKTISIIEEKAPTLFPEPNEVFRHVRSWFKLRELCLLLEGTLNDIDMRWADGKGPLADLFTAEEVRSLVTALFQQSDRRALLLSQII